MGLQKNVIRLLSFQIVVALFLVIGAFADQSFATTVIGNLDGVYTDGAGGAWVAGWTCAVGDTSPITVSAYAGTDTPSGELVGSMSANQPNEAAVNTACQSTGGHYRFGIHVTPQQLAVFTGEVAYVHGINPTTGVGVNIAGSGTMRFPAATALTTCAVSSMSTLASCFAKIADYESISFVSDVTCTGTACCPSGGAALMNVSGQSYKVINGNGHSLHRLASTTNGIGYESRCPALAVSNSNYIRVSSLSLDEDETVPSCSIAGGTYSSNCANAVNVQGSDSIDFESFGVYNGKGYVFAVSTSNGVIFNKSVMAEAGIIGIIEGTSSQGIFVTNSVIARSVANGIALTGVSGASLGDNSISHNIFNANHHRGAWPAGNGVYITGGQVYPQTANFLDVHDNVIADGACTSCAGTGQPNAWAFEIGGTSGSTPSAPVSNFETWNNYIYNGNGLPFQMDYNSQFGGHSVLGGHYNLTEPADVIRGFSGNPGSFAARPNLSSFDLNDAYWGATYSYPVVATGATFSFNDSVSDADATLDRGGLSDYTIYRLRSLSTGTHSEAGSANEGNALSNGTAVLEGVFGLSPSPRVGGSMNPIYRCYLGGNADYDFASLDPNCGGKARSFHSILGYSYESTHAGAAPLYSCLNGTSDYFVSSSSTCEGQKVIAKLGYSISYRYLMPITTYTQGVQAESDFPNTRAIPGLTYSISPALPAGLRLSTTTGVISGTPAVYSPMTRYTVNLSGRFAASIMVSIGIRPALAYNLPNLKYTIGQNVSDPLSTGSHASQFTNGFTIAPALPTGLVFNTSTGAITGQPTASVQSAFYTVTGLDPEGHTSVTQVMLNGIAIYELMNGVDQLLSTTSNEGESSGFVPVSEQFEIAANGNGIDATPIYRCISGAGHFLSNGSTCEGQTFDQLLGYISTSNQGGMLPLYRYSNPVGNLIALTSRSKVPSGYTLQGRLGYVWPPEGALITTMPVYQAQTAADLVFSTTYSSSTPPEFDLATATGNNLEPLYSCSFSAGHFLSNSSGCENQTVIGVLGYISKTNTGSLLPLYRYSNSAGNHFESTSGTPPSGYTLEGVLGYVW